MSRIPNRQFFTLIELAAVAAIIGIAVTMFIVRVDNVIPSARLSAAARLVGSSVELALSDAIMKGEQRSVVYDLRGRAVRIEKKSDRNPEESIVLAEHNLPAGVEIAEIEGAETEDGSAVIAVSSFGRMTPHAAHLSSTAGEMTVEIYGITGRVRYHNERVSLREFTKDAEEE